MSNVADEQDRSPPTIAEDLKCTQCGYNLRGLTLGKLCPECGTPIERSIHGNLLKYADPDWVNKLRLGTLLMLWNLLIVILLNIAVGILTVTGAAQAGANMLSLIVGFLELWAVFLLTTPEPAIAFGEDPITLRKLVRTCAVIDLVGQMLGEAVPTGGSQAWAFIAAGVIILVGIVALFGQFIFLRRFAERIPDTRLAKTTTTVMWGLVVTLVLVPLAGYAVAATAGGLAATGAPAAGQPPTGGGTVGVLIVVLACAAFLGLAVFGIWYVLLLFRYHAAFKTASLEARQTILPASTSEQAGASSVGNGE